MQYTRTVEWLTTSGRGPCPIVACAWLPWATPGHREILDACKAGDFVRGAGLPASHLARTGFEVLDLLDPAYDPSLLTTALADAGGDVPAKRSRG